MLPRAPSLATISSATSLDTLSKTKPRHGVDCSCLRVPVNVMNCIARREVAEKNVLMKMTEEEQERQSSVGQVEEILGRRLEGRVLKYECSFVGMGPKHNR